MSKTSKLNIDKAWSTKRSANRLAGYLLDNRPILHKYLKQIKYLTTDGPFFGTLQLPSQISSPPIPIIDSAERSETRIVIQPGHKVQGTKIQVPEEERN